MRRLFYILALILVVSVSGCGSSSGDKENELIVWLVGSETQAKTINEIAKEFYENTGIKTRCEAVSWGEAHSKYLTSIAGGVTPDIGMMGLTWGAEFGNLGSIVDLNEMFPEGVKSIKEKVFPGLWESVDYEGKIYGIPFDMTEHILYYRTDIIERPPETWPALVELLKELRKENKGMLFDWGSLSWIGYSVFLWQAGGDYFDKDYSKSTLDTDEAVRGLEFFANLYNELGVPKTQIPIEQGMRTGEFPLAIAGNWKIVSITIGAPEIKGKWAIATLPKGPSGKDTAFVGGRIMSVFEKSKMKKEAWQFIKFLFKPQNQVKLYERAAQAQDAYLPPNMNTWDNLPMEESFKKILKKQALHAKGPPPVSGWDAATVFIDEAIQKVILTKKDARQELTRATQLIDKNLKK